MLSNIHRNIMGTVSFDAKFPGMRKPQDFIVYPMKEAQAYIEIQSDTRIGVIQLESGTVTLSKPKPNGAYMIHLNGASIVDRLDSETLLLLKSAIMATASGKAGTNGIVYTDNSGALEVFNQGSQP